MSRILAAGAARMKLEAENYEARIAALEAQLAELAAENERQSSDIAEFMRRLGPRWFLEQGWFPESAEVYDAV